MKKILSLLLCFAMIFGMATAVTAAEETRVIWQNSFDSEADFSGDKHIGNTGSISATSTTRYFDVSYADGAMVLNAIKPYTDNTDPYGRVRVFNVEKVTFQKGGKYEFTFRAKGVPAEEGGNMPGLRMFVLFGGKPIKSISGTHTGIQAYPGKEVSDLNADYTDYTFSFEIESYMSGSGADATALDIDSSEVTLAFEAIKCVVGDKVYIENAKITESGVAAPTVPVADEIVKMGFDNAASVTDSKISMRGATVAFDANGGNNGGAAKFTSTVDTTANKGRWLNIKGVTWKKGATYNISFRAKASAETSGNEMMIDFSGNPIFIGGASNGANYPTYRYALKETWETYNYSFTIDGFAAKGTTKPIDESIASVSDASMMFEMKGFPAGSNVWFDDFVVTELIKVDPAKPVVEDVKISGMHEVGKTLTAEANITDVNKEDILSAKYQWQYKNGDTWTDISGKTEQTYVVEEAYVGKQLRVVVTPVSNNTPKTGTPVESAATGAVVAFAEPPSVENVAFSGTAEVGGKLTASYTYKPSAANIAEGESEIIWETADTEDGAYTAVQTSSSKEYSVKVGDAGKWIRVRVIPKDTVSRAGEAVAAKAVKVEGKIEFFVALDGKDTNLGTKDSPFRTIEAARDAIRGIAVKPAGGITVNIREGIYEVSETMTFGAQDSGTEDCIITYKAYEGEKVSFIGGKKLDASKMQKVTDSAILDYINEEEAKNHIYMLDLEAQGVTMDKLRPWGWSNGWSSSKNPAPMRIYMNNTVLDYARWPNKDQSQLLVECRPLTAKDGINEDEINTKNTPAMMEFPDPENRSANWNLESKDAVEDAFIGGSVAHFWASDQLLLEYVDSKTKIFKTFTPSSYASVKGAGWGPEHKLYFGNILAEIDKPGESYVDRNGRYGKKGVVYFYPVGSINDAEMVVSTLRKAMIYVNGAEYLHFDGLDFKDTIDTPVSIYKSNKIEFRNADISNTSSGAVSITQSKNTKVSGCNIYTTAVHPITITGAEAERKQLIPSGVVIENNNIHNTSLLTTTRASRAAINVSNIVGVQVRHNEFNDLDFGAMDLSNANDTVFEYNTVKNAEQNTTDAGAIYWGRQISTLGNVIRYNYWENIGSYLISVLLEGGGAGSIFVDDASTAGDYYGNVFLNGGAERGATCANGGEFGNVHGNISIDTVPDRSEYAYAHRVWGYLDGLTNKHDVDTTKLNKKAPIGSYIYINNFRDKFGSSNSGCSYHDYLWTDTWKEHYKGTQWERTLQQYSKERYDSVKALYDVDKCKEIIEFLSKDLPNEHTTNIHDNVAIGELRMNSLANHYNNYTGTQDQITEEDKALFVDFDNKDFTLTPEGLKKIQEKAPEFKDIPFREMGLLSEVGGAKPVVEIKPEVITGIAAPGNTISPAYTYSDADGDLEGATKVYWYVADKANGNFELVRFAETKNFKITTDYAGKFLKYEIVPYDTTVHRGETVKSEVIAIREASSVDFSKLGEAIAEAKNLADNAVIGTGNGTFAQESVDTLREALSAAQAVANNANVKQFEVNDAVKALEVAINKFKASENITIEFVSIKDMLENEAGWVDETGAALTAGDNKFFNNGELVLANGDVVRYTADTFLNEIFTFKMRLEPVTPADELPAIPEANTDTKVTDKPVYNINGAGFKVRGQNTSGEVYDKSKDYGLLVWLKNTDYELQEYYPDNADGITSFTNKVFNEFGKDYVVSVGAYDVGDTTRFVLYVDNELVGDVECKKTANVGRDGFLAFRGPGGTTKMIISAAESDTSALKAKIAEVEAVIGTAEAGNDYGQYSADVIAELEAIVAEAKALDEEDAQLVVDRMILNLDNAMKDFSAAANNTSSNASGEYVINYDLEKAEFNVADNKAVVLKLDTKEHTPAISTSTVTDKGTIKMEIPRGTDLEGANWNGEIKTPAKTETPSANAGTGIIVSGVYNVADTAVVADRLVRFVLPGEGSKRVYYKNETGKYVEVKTRASEDSEAAANAAINEIPGAAKIKVGNDLVIYTNFITEFVTFSAGSADDSDDYVDNGGSQGGGSYAPSAGGSSTSSGFFVSDTITAGLDASGDFVFDDMANHWAKADVMGMYNAGIVTGVTANTFEPDRNITRAEFATLIVKALSLTPEKTADFTDVKDEWFAPFVGAAAKAGIIAGSDGAFRPNDTITRQEMAIIVMKAYALLGKTAGTGAIDNFADKADIAVWAMPYVDGAATAGLISGMGDGTFAPNANATRAQSASLISRILK